MGTFLVATGVGGMVTGSLAFASSPTARDHFDVVDVIAGGLVALITGIAVIVRGLPDDAPERPVPTAMLVRAGAVMFAVVSVVAAWPLGLYERAWIAWNMHESPCASLLSEHDIASSGGPAYDVSLATRTAGGCELELVSRRSARDVASLRIEITHASGKTLRRRLRPYGRPVEEISNVGDEAYRIRRAHGQIVGVRRGERVAVIQFPSSAWDARSVDAAIAALARNIRAM